MKTLVVDCNGSLMDGRNFWKERSTRVAKLLCGKPSTEFSHYWKIQYHAVATGKILLEEYYAKLGKALEREVDNEVDELFQGKERLSYPELPEDLSFLKQKFGSQLKIGVLSNYLRHWVLAFLSKHNIKRHFSSVICADSHGVWKPGKEAFIRIADALNVRPQDCLYVGDTKEDLSMAQKVGMKPLFIRGQEIDVEGFSHITRIKEITKYL